MSLEDFVASPSEELLAGLNKAQLLEVIPHYGLICNIRGEDLESDIIPFC